MEFLTKQPNRDDGRSVLVKERWSSLPSVPVIADTLPGYEVISFLGVAVPNGTPQSVVEKLNAEIRRVLKLADIRERFKALGGEQRSASAADTQGFVAGEIRKWKAVVSDRGIERQ